MNNNNTAYKDSPLGKIPVDWEVKRLGEVCTTFKSGYGITSEEINVNGDYAVYGGNGLRGYTNKYTHDGNFFLIGRQGALCGNITRVSGKNYISEHAIAVQTDKKNDNSFLAYKLDFQNLNRHSESSAQPGLSVEKLVRLKIALPPLPEQKAIANILNLMDSAINKNNQLIAKKELQKKWLMQNLLTGKKRLLNDESGILNYNWKTIKLGDVFEFIKSYSISRAGLSKSTNENLIYCIHYGDIHAFYETDFLDFSNQHSIPQIIDKAQIIYEKDYLKEGDIIMADASEDYKGVGEAIVVLNLEKKTAVGGLHTIVLRDYSGETESIFRGYLFASESIRNRLRTKATGTSVYSVTKSTLESLTLLLPPVKEQKAIAQVLQTADKEIQLLKAKTEKLCELKKGLMQVLLTGKKSLLIETE